MRVGPYHEDIARRDHHRRFRIGGRQQEVRLRSALQTLETCEEPLRLALERVCPGRPNVTPTELHAAIRLLVYGPKGEFR